MQVAKIIADKYGDGIIGNQSSIECGNTESGNA